MNADIESLQSQLAKAKERWRIAKMRADAAMDRFQAHEIDRAWSLREVERLEDEISKSNRSWWNPWKA